MTEDHSSSESNTSQPVELLTTIIRSIPVGYGGYIIGKKGVFKAKLLEEYGAFLVLYNDPNDCSRQIITLSCPEDQKKIVEQIIDYKISQLKTITIKTVTSKPSLLRPNVQCGKLVPGYVMNSGETDDLMIILDPETPNKNYSKQFLELHSEIQQDYIRTSNLSKQNYVGLPPHLPRPISSGCICIAHGIRNQFYRALVMETFCDAAPGVSGGCATLYFVDIGKFECLPFDRLFKIRVKYLSLMFHAIPAKWNNIEIAADTFPGAPTLIRHKFLLEPSKSGVPVPRKVYFYFTHQKCCIPQVSIYIPRPNGSNGEFIDLLELLTQLGLARPIRSQIDDNNSESGESLNENSKFHKQPNFQQMYEAYTDFNDCRYEDDSRDVESAISRKR